MWLCSALSSQAPREALGDSARRKGLLLLRGWAGERMRTGSRCLALGLALSGRPGCRSTQKPPHPNTKPPDPHHFPSRYLVLEGSGAGAERERWPLGRLGGGRMDRPKAGQGAGGGEKGTQGGDSDVSLVPLWHPAQCWGDVSHGRQVAETEAARPCHHSSHGEALLQGAPLKFSLKKIH